MTGLGDTPVELSRSGAHPGLHLLAGSPEGQRLVTAAPITVAVVTTVE